jgi:hypothetical protein
MFPPELARRLSEATTAALLPDDPADRWIAVLEAVAFSPVRTLVTPTTAPTTVTDDLRATVLRLGPALPQFAALLGVEIPAGTPKPKPLRPGPPRKDGRGEGRSDGRTRRDSKPRQPRPSEGGKESKPKDQATHTPPTEETTESPAAPAAPVAPPEAPADTSSETVTEAPTETQEAAAPDAPVAEIPTESAVAPQADTPSEVTPDS